MKLFVSWSGGKDCSLAAYRALDAGHELVHLVSMLTLEVGRMYPHHFTPEILKGQAEAMDLPILLNWTSGKEYTKSYKKMLKELKKKGIDGGVFGDVSRGNPDADEHRQWIDEVCHAADMEVYLPLWEEDREQIIGEMISSGFESVIIAADDNLGEDWLGKKLDSAMLARLKTLHRNSHNGEVGLYHTLVVDGPLFKRRVHLDETEIVYRKYGLYDGKPTISPFWYFDIKSFRLIDKAKGESNRP
jgi:uncharacterized protein (TIGR00290 family)